MDRTLYIPAWLVRCCRRLTSGFGLLWSGLFNIFLSLITTWLFTAADSQFNAYHITTFLHHWPVTLVSLVALALLTLVVRRIGKCSIIESPRALKRQYLTSWISQTQNIAIEGIPLLPPSMQLDEIFIAMQLHPHLSTIDQLLTEQQRKLLREDIHRGIVAPEAELVLIAAEREFQRMLNHSERIEIQQIWQHLTKEHPVAVIQGRPGMGKSTLLQRIVLYMARRGLRKLDPLGDTWLSPELVPLFIRLGNYATFRQGAKDGDTASIWSYLRSSLQDLAAPGTPEMQAWLYERLKHGQCFVLFDGLDEVSKEQDRYAVQEAINAFIIDVNAKASGAASYNRFLITSRVACYDPNVFSSYSHYTLAELTPEQIRQFLPRWCRACVRGESYNHQKVTSQDVEANISRRAVSMEEKLILALEGNQGIRTLAENPFLLTLLAVMQHNGIELPSRRVELYETITQVLLERRNAVRNLPGIPEAQAIQRLGPIAYEMQATKNNFASRREILASFAHIIEQTSNVSQEEAQKEAELFLERVRVRGGIFVFRAGNFLGFFHRSFQEYFTARHLLRLLVAGSLTVESLLGKAHQQDDLWREPFLLAVAYATKDEAPMAQQIMKSLLLLSSGAVQKRRFHNILLVGECLVEAREATIPSAIERDIVRALLELYEEALQGKENEVCEQVENILRRLLNAVSNEAELSPLLLVLQETLLGTQALNTQPSHLLRVTLTLLALIAHDLRPCTEVVFARLVPPLLGMAQLSEIGPYKPMQPKALSDLNTADLAFAALCFMGIRGPSGTALNHLHPRFEHHLDQLARNSQQIGFLITPVVMPFDQAHADDYRKEIQRWRQLCEQAKKSKGSTQQNIATCTQIHRDLLATAQDVCYPAAVHLLAMLDRSEACSSSDWQTIWQDYLQEQMKTGTYLDYQVSALLWTTLWPTLQGIGSLTSILQDHFSDSAKPQQFAQRFLCGIVNDLRDLDYVSNFQGLINASSLSAVPNTKNDVRYPRYVQYVGKMGFSLEDVDNQFIKHMSYLNDLRQAKYSGNLDKLRHWSLLRYKSYMSYWDYLKDMDDSNDTTVGSDVRYVRCLRQFCTIFFTELIRREAERRLPTCVEAERRELLTVLLGRIFSIREDGKRDQSTQQEVQHIVEVVLPFALAGSEEKEVLLDMIRFLPACTEQEIVYVLDLARMTQDDEIQKACAYTVRSCKPKTNEAWTLLAQARTLSIPVIREAVEWHLEQRKQDE